MPRMRDSVHREATDVHPECAGVRNMARSLSNRWNSFTAMGISGHRRRPLRLRRSHSTFWPMAIAILCQKGSKSFLSRSEMIRHPDRHKHQPQASLELRRIPSNPIFTNSPPGRLRHKLRSSLAWDITGNLGTTSICQPKPRNSFGDGRSLRRLNLTLPWPRIGKLRRVGSDDAVGYFGSGVFGRQVQWRAPSEGSGPLVVGSAEPVARAESQADAGPGQSVSWASCAGPLCRTASA